MKTSTKNAGIAVIVIIAIVLIVSGMSKKGASIAPDMTSPTSGTPVTTGTTATQATQTTSSGTTVKPAGTPASATPTKTPATPAVTTGSVNVVSTPKSGDILYQGETYTVTWMKSAFATDQVAITLVDGSGQCVLCNVDPISLKNSGSNVYTVPQRKVAQDQTSVPWVPETGGYRLKLQEYPDRVGRTSKSYLSPAFYIRTKTN